MFEMHTYFFYIFLATLLTGCAMLAHPPKSILEVQEDTKHRVSIIDPRSQLTLSWEELIERLSATDVVLLGEQHDHVVGHAMQLEIVREIMDRFQGSTLALEMIERDEQRIVDDYLDGLISEDVFAKLTHSENWSGQGTWAAWYQPIIAEAKKLDGHVLAANAPRRYTRLARTGGFEAIDELPSERRVYVEYPEELSVGKYKERFWELAAHDVDDESMLPYYRSQQVWDATIAGSIALANPTSHKKVILLVGQFHVEFDGGVVQELRKRMPNVSIIVVTIHRVLPEEEWSGTPPIADILIIEDGADLR